MSHIANIAYARVALKCMASSKILMLHPLLCLIFKSGLGRTVYSTSANHENHDSIPTHTIARLLKKMSYMHFNLALI